MRGRNLFVRGDNLAAMRMLLDRGERFALAYLDPPFMTGRSFSTSDGEEAFDDRWQSAGAYVDALALRVEAARRLLTSDGAIVVHADPTFSHRVRNVLDRVFGERCFASEIVWRYRRWPARTRNFQKMHDVLIRYRASHVVEPRWTQLYEPLAPSTLRTFGGGRQLAKIGADGRRVRSVASSEESSSGAALGDVWEIPIIAPSSAERTVYPTQKPLALLVRLVEATTLAGDDVLEPYAGSGTASMAAHARGRGFCACDASPASRRVFRARAKAQGAAYVEMGA